MHLGAVTPAEIERRVADALTRPGLMPRLTAAALNAPTTAARLRSLIDETAVAGRPATSFPPEILRAWADGLVLLVDSTSAISERSVVHAKRLVVRDSAIGAFSAIYGDGVLIEHSIVKGHAVLNGPLVVQRGLFSWHVLVGPIAIVTDTTLGAFCKVQRDVRITTSRIGAGTHIEGGTHPEMLPLGPMHRGTGVQIGPDAWVGQQCSVTAGAVIGAGVVVAAQTSITRAFDPHVFVSGSPARAAPIDFAIRGLSSDEAEREGRLQGRSAALLPIYGRAEGTLVAPHHLRIAYPEHGVVRGVASDRLLDFQRGALAVALIELFPGNPPDVRVTVGAGVVFDATFMHAVDQGARARDPSVASWWATLMAGPRYPAAGEVAVRLAVAPPTGPSCGEDGTLAVVLGVLGRLIESDEGIDPDQTFDALGLDSLGKVELSVRLEEQFAIPAPDVFTHNTARALAAVVARLLSAT